VLAVVCDAGDAGARALVDLWPGSADRLTPRDLSCPGWRWEPGRPGEATAVVGGRVVAARDIDLLVTRLPGVAPAHLPWIAAASRDYVAAEMTAHLAAWLAELPCPVLNRPHPSSLAGPPWQRPEWVRAAHRAGLDVEPATCLAGADPERDAAEAPADPVLVEVVAGRAFGGGRSAAAEARRAAALRLATATGVEILRVAFAAGSGPPRVVDADMWCDLSTPEAAAALVARARRAPGTRAAVAA
jgi:hypothetical protein